MDYLYYYFESFYYNFLTFPIVVRIAIFITLVFAILILGLWASAIYDQVKFLRRLKKKKCTRNNYNILERVLKSRYKISYEKMEKGYSDIADPVEVDKKELVELMLKIRKKNSGYFNSYNLQSIVKLFKLDEYWDLCLSKGSLKLKMDTLQNIIDLQASISESVLINLVYHKNNDLRKRARIAQIHLSQHDPFKFFEEDFDHDFTEWDKIKIHDILRFRPKNTIPNFARWIPKVKNEDLKCLFIYEIAYYKQYENKQFLFDLFKSTSSDRVKQEILKTLSVLGIDEFSDELVNEYPTCSEVLQVDVVESLNQSEDKEALLPFLVNSFTRAYETDLKITIGRAILKSGESGKKEIDHMEKKAIGFDSLVFDHIKNPLLFN